MLVLWVLSLAYANLAASYDDFQAILKKDSVCMKDLGCFNITDDFKKRPYNVLPNDRAVINTQFKLFTKQSPKEAHYLDVYDESTFTSSDFHPDHPTKFIIHGYVDSESIGPWMQRIKDEYLMQSDYNVILVDWSGGNRNLYSQATANTRVVGAEIALMIVTLEKRYGIKSEDCHVLGHSLGSHVSGYVGERLQVLGRKLGRITGLDPAGPLFEGMPPSVRLDPTDANFVDIIHTNAGLLGMRQMVGHIDFYPNGGATQPGCRSVKGHIKLLLKDGINELFRSLSGCHHQRVVDLVRFSINYKKALPVGFECKDYDSFLAGECADCGSDMAKCAVMGVNADEYIPRMNKSVQRGLYLQTGKEAPYWLHQYQVIVHLYKPRVKYQNRRINMELNLHGSDEDFLSQVMKSKPIVHGDQYKFMVSTDKKLGEIKSVTLKWSHTSLNPLKLIFKPKLFVDYIVVVPLNDIEKSPRKLNGRVYCGKPQREILPKSVTYFHKDDSCISRVKL